MSEPDSDDPAKEPTEKQIDTAVRYAQDWLKENSPTRFVPITMLSHALLAVAAELGSRAIRPAYGPGALAKATLIVDAMLAGYAHQSTEQAGRDR